MFKFTKTKYYLLFSVQYLFALLPFWALYVLSDMLYPILYYIVRYRRKMVRKNLINSFPNSPKSKILKIERAFYRHFCDYFFETIKLLHISPEEMKKRMKFENIDLLERLTEDGNSVIVYLGHYGNWEWVPSLALHVPKDSTLAQIYQQINNAAFEKLFNHIRTQFGSLNIERSIAIKEIIKMRNKGLKSVIGFVTDQRPFGYYPDYWTTFLQQDTLVLIGAERLARMTGFSTVYLDIKQVKRGYYQGAFSVLSVDPKNEPKFAISERYMRKLEKTILRNPSLWLWSHNRWKYSKETHQEIKSE